jgi:hypothetical protein
MYCVQLLCSATFLPILLQSRGESSCHGVLAPIYSLLFLMFSFFSFPPRFLLSIPTHSPDKGLFSVCQNFHHFLPKNACIFAKTLLSIVFMKCLWHACGVLSLVSSFSLLIPNHLNTPMIV